MNTTTTSRAEAAEKQRQAASEKAMERVSRAWGRRLSPKDLIEALPLLNEKLESAREALNTTWADALAGRATPEQFNTALKAWEDANYTAAAALKAVR